jgi:hypothetical protein
LKTTGGESSSSDSSIRLDHWDALREGGAVVCFSKLHFSVAAVDAKRNPQWNDA